MAVEIFYPMCRKTPCFSCGECQFFDSRLRGDENGRKES